MMQDTRDQDPESPMSIRIGWSHLTFLCLLAVFSIITFCHVPIALAGEPQWVEVRSPNFP
jgi:hypothetical protein